HLEALEAAGAIERIPGRARGIRVLRTPAPPQATLEFTDADVGAAIAAISPTRTRSAAIIAAIAAPTAEKPGLPAAAKPGFPANAPDILELPVLGQVAAGVPIGADIGSDQM